jgi:hypothetical protein
MKAIETENGGNSEVEQFSSKIVESLQSIMSKFISAHKNL